MKIKETIKKHRLQCNYTQEQVALKLGVSTPAVNKWESGATFPDITLLAPLARLLEIDLNTLLCFEKECSDEQFAKIITEISSDMLTESFDEIFKKCLRIIKEYPNSDKLKYNLGLLCYSILKEDESENKKKVQSLIEECTHSDDRDIRYSSLTSMININIKEKNYDEAKQCIDSIPNAPYDKMLSQALLFKAKKDFDQASTVLEGKLIKLISDLHTTFTMLVDIALEENRFKDALHISEVVKNVGSSLSLWSFNYHAMCIGIYTKMKDKENTLISLKSLFDCLDNEQYFNDQVLCKYDETTSKKFNETIKGLMLKQIEIDPKDLEFIKDDPRFIKLFAKK